MNNKVIKVLNEEHGKRVIEFWKKYCDTMKFEGIDIGHYYGIINGGFNRWSINEIIEASAEIIELPEEKTYAKEFEPVEVTLEEIAEWKGVNKEQIIIKQ